MEPKQRGRWLILAGFASGIFLSGLNFVYLTQILVRKDWENISAGKQTAMLYQGLLARSEVLQNRRSVVTEMHTRLSREVRNRVFDYIAPVDSPFVWANSVMNQHASRMGVTVTSLSPIENLRPVWPLSSEPGARVLGAYATRAELVCPLDDAVKLMTSLERENPCLCITSITILPARGDKNLRRVNFVVEWPSWVDSDESRRVQKMLMPEQIISKQVPKGRGAGYNCACGQCVHQADFRS